MNNKMELTEQEWKEKLSREQFFILRKKGTECAFTGKYWNHAGEGIYFCAGCGSKLFESDTKFESGCGWPSFYDPASTDNIEEKPDYSHGMNRTEVLCKTCGGHLGHVFKDGPPPTGLLYCINSEALEFKEN